MKEAFRQLSDILINAVGSVYALLFAVFIIIGWILTGPILHFSDTWQLTINTGTTIITFLMVFIIQNSANREAKATQIKLDELLRAIERANNNVIGIESKPDEQMERIAQEVLAAQEDVNTGG